MTPVARVLLLVTAAGLAGCGAPEKDPDSRDHELQTDEAVFDSLGNTLEDAGAVEDLTLRQKARMDAALSQMEEGEAPEER